MLVARQPRRFSLLLLDEGEDYVGGWGAAAAWPPSVTGNWSGAARVAGRLRLPSKSLFFEADDARVPIARCVHLAHAPHAGVHTVGSDSGNAGAQ